MWDKRLISYCIRSRRGKAEVCVKVPCLWEEIMPGIFMAGTHSFRFSRWLNLGAEMSPVPFFTCESPVTPGTAALLAAVPTHCAHSSLQQLWPGSKRADQDKPQASQV